jgi:hypothetical protein
MLDDISTWASKETKTIQVTEGYGSSPLILQVSKFVPTEGDSLQRHWVYGGIKKSATLPPYAIFDLVTAEQSYKDYINRGGAEFFKNALDYEDKLLWNTYSTAIATANNTDTASPRAEVTSFNANILCHRRSRRGCS